MSDVAYPSDFLEENREANALNAAQNRSRIDAIRTQRASALDVNSRRGSVSRGASGAPQQRQATPKTSASNATNKTENDTAEEEETAEGDLRFHIHMLEQRGKALKKAAEKDEMTAESMEISNTWVDIAASSIIETGKASLEILIGFLILPAGFMMKVVKFFFDKQIMALKSSSQKKNEQGEKILAQAAKLRGRSTPLKRASSAIINPVKNYIAEILAEFFPLGFSPLVIFESAKEKQKSFYKLLMRAAFFCLALGMSLALIVTLIYFLFELFCSANLLCVVGTKWFNISAETALKLIGK